MEIRYENSLDQLVDLYRYQLKNHPQLKKRNIRAVLVSPLLLFGAFALIGLTKDDLALAVAGFAAALCVSIFELGRYRRWPDKAARDQAKSGALDDVLCQHTVTITGDRFQEATCETLISSSWRSIHDIAFTNDYVFVFPNPAMALIIPRIGIGDEQFAEFTRQTRYYFEASKSER